MKPQDKHYNDVRAWLGTIKSIECHTCQRVSLILGQDNIAYNNILKHTMALLARCAKVPQTREEFERLISPCFKCTCCGMRNACMRHLTLDEQLSLNAFARAKQREYEKLFNLADAEMIISDSEMAGKDRVDVLPGEVSVNFFVDDIPQNYVSTGRRAYDPSSGQRDVSIWFPNDE